MSGITITPESVMSKFFIRYEKFNEMMYFTFNGLNVNTVNIYIDLYSAYHSILSRSYTTTIKDYLAITSMSINLCAHYRAYFKSLGIATKIFIISSFNVPKDSIALVPEYNRIMIDKMNNGVMRDMINLNIELLELICPYLPDIHFIKTEFESSVIMNEIMNRELPDQSLIFSSDIYPAQLCALRNNVSLICPIKGFGTDNSFIIPQNTSVRAKETFWAGITRKFMNSSSFEKVGSFSPSNLMLLGSINLLKDRCLPNIYNINRSINLISRTYGYDSIKITPQSVFDYDTEGIISEENKILISNRYNTLDISYQSILFNNSIESKTLHYENLEDNNAINIINDKYFANNPIDIFRL
jgi:hypothetical protein